MSRAPARAPSDLRGGRAHDCPVSRTVSESSAADHFTGDLATPDRHLITASGLGSIELTMEVFGELGAATLELRSVWHEAFKHGKCLEDFAGGARSESLLSPSTSTGSRGSRHAGRP